LIFPNLIRHTIDKDSPFYDMSAKDLLEQRFEVVVSMTGISKHTAQMTQARTSYLSREIMWGHRFTNVVSYDKEMGTYLTHVDELDSMEQIDTALCSAKRLDELVDEFQDKIECGAVNGNLKSVDEYDDENDDDGDVSGLHMV
jgi:potassium inwardly-rectifying channel subfamily J